MTIKSIETITIIGAGTMGHGIAQVAAQAGYQVFLYDLQQSYVDRGCAAIAANLDAGIARGLHVGDRAQRACSDDRIGHGLGHKIASHVAAGARAVLDNDLLVKVRREPLRRNA